MEDTNSPTTSPEPEAMQKGDPSRMLIWSGVVLVAFVIGMAAGYLVWARPLEMRLANLEQQIAAESQAVAEAQAQQDQAAQEQVTRYDVPLGNNPILGDPDAEITIIEFSDYECPYCQRWHADVLPKIFDKYGDKVRLVYRDFPLYNIHPNAGQAAEAAICAGEEDRYWDYNKLLFSGQDRLGRQTFEKYAEEIGLNMPNFNQCLDEQRYRADVDADYEYASQFGVRSTPTFFINGLAVVGAQPFEVFERIIDMELAGEIP
jgi:protein-disulfide isomerase